MRAVSSLCPSGLFGVLGKAPAATKEQSTEIYPTSEGILDDVGEVQMLRLTSSL